MSILNITNDGNYPELIVLFRTVFQLGPVDQDTLIEMCCVEDNSHLKGILKRWTTLGLFIEEDKKIQVNKQLDERLNDKEQLDVLTRNLPQLCRRLVFSTKNCTPVLADEKYEKEEKNAGKCSDFVRAIAWALAQDIYEFPTTWDGEAEQMIIQQVSLLSQPLATNFIQNDTRFNGLRFWAQYLGFATGDSKTFFLDPTSAVREELSAVFGNNDELSAPDFVNKLHSILPVLDFGVYRKEIENVLRPETWVPPPLNHLSMSLSFAIKRLEFDGIVVLEDRSDSSNTLGLTRKKNKPWGRFSHLQWRGQS
ncbi:MAG: hypothetical protein HQM12_16105 [SAR324 cluster bacterium]|nr:hypothetical protein [SAR324 cluster bacterium]